PTSPARAERAAALRAHPRHVTDRMPDAALGLHCRLGILVIDVEHAAESADVHLARLARGNGPALVVEQRDLDIGRRPAARAGLAQDVLGPEDRVDPELRRAVELVEAGAEVAERRLLDPHRAR